MSDQKKIFLSHKGKDKKLVRDFKKTLETIGYQPWLDEDAMPAGTSLERGILQGMKDSCAVVFFITPSFKDEGFLESEINYAIKEKRSKGDNFSIITLQFVDDAGNKGLIPELLQHYVWKTPKTNLEALREIIRALPIIPNNIEPETKSNSIQLSEEAQVILREASASRDGKISHDSLFAGESIEVNYKSLIPNQDSRTIERWISALESLKDKKLIRALNDQDDLFKITTKGYNIVNENILANL